MKERFICRHCGGSVVAGPNALSPRRSIWRHENGDVICPGVIYTSNGPINRHKAEPLGKK